jgi:hypothetical protein
MEAAMRVYSTGRNPEHRLYVSPAADRRAAGNVDSGWLHPNGKARLFEVHFRDGMAEVPDALGRYLCATGQAKRTRLWLPGLVRAA